MLKKGLITDIIFSMQYDSCITSYLDTPAGKVPVVSTTLNSSDIIGSIKVRFGIGRMKYAVEPGIYAAGNPDKNSIVLVTANYKLTFDALRKELDGIDAWILVLDTKGINVWCAAGKGTFGTLEVVNRINATQLEKLVPQRNLILPQLAAAGVSAHNVNMFSGFTVKYGPVRARDIKEYVKNGFKCDDKMRRVSFTFKERLVLVPVEILTGIKPLFLGILAFFLLSGLSKNGYSIGIYSLTAVLNIAAAYLAGCVLGPLLLPWLPGRSFSMKGYFAGVIAVFLLLYFRFAGNNAVSILTWMLLLAPVSSFVTMNFTGSSTYTSPSGVRKEMRIAIPLQITSVFFGIILYIVTRLSE
jgi:hypothetical protein